MLIYSCLSSALKFLFKILTIRSFVAPIFISLLLSSFQSALADDPQNPVTCPIEEPTASKFEERQDINEESIIAQGLEIGRKSVSSGYLKLISATDNFLSGKRLERDINDSYLKVEVKSTYFSDSSARTGIALKGRVDLPGTENRLKLFIDSDNDSEHSLEDRARPISNGQEVQQESTILGLEFAQKMKERGWQNSVRLGSKVRSTPRAFARIQTQKRWPFGRGISFFTRNELWYLASSGPGNTTRFELEKKHQSAFKIRLMSEFDYRDEYQTLDYLHQIVLNHNVPPNWNINYRVGLLVEHDKQIKEERIFTSIDIRKKVYEDWVYLSLAPELYQSDANHKSQLEHSITLKLELLFLD